MNSQTKKKSLWSLMLRAASFNVSEGNLFSLCSLKFLFLRQILVYSCLYFIIQFIPCARPPLAGTCMLQSHCNERRLATYWFSQLAVWAQCEVTGHETALRFAWLSSRQGRVMHPTFLHPKKPPVHRDMCDG